MLQPEPTRIQHAVVQMGEIVNVVADLAGLLVERCKQRPSFRYTLQKIMEAYVRDGIQGVRNLQDADIEDEDVDFFVERIAARVARIVSSEKARREMVTEICDTEMKEVERVAVFQDTLNKRLATG